MVGGGYAVIATVAALLPNLRERLTVGQWIGVLLVLSCKEEMVVPIGAWGLVTLLDRERRRVGAALVVLAAVWAVVCFGVIIPYHNEGQAYRFWELWAHLPGISAMPAGGGGGQAIARASLPTVALFLIHLFLPLGLLPFYGPAALAVALPALAYLLLGQRPSLHSVGYQYPAVLIPWFFLAAAEGLRRLRRHPLGGNRRHYRLGLAFMVVGTIGTNIPLNPILVYARGGMLRPEPHHDQAVEALALIPPDAGVAAINQFGPHLADRRVLVRLECPAPFRLDHVAMADYVLLDLVDCRSVPMADQRAGYRDIVAQVLGTGQYGVGYWSDRILLLERGELAEGELEAVLDYVDDLVEQGRPCWP
jgi:hypothetical protein